MSDIWAELEAAAEGERARGSREVVVYVDDLDRLIACARALRRRQWHPVDGMMRCLTCGSPAKTGHKEWCEIGQALAQ